LKWLRYSLLKFINLFECLYDVYFLFYVLSCILKGNCIGTNVYLVVLYLYLCNNRVQLPLCDWWDNKFIFIKTLRDGEGKARALKAFLHNNKQKLSIVKCLKGPCNLKQNDIRNSYRSIATLGQETRLRRSKTAIEKQCEQSEVHIKARMATRQPHVWLRKRQYIMDSNRFAAYLSAESEDAQHNLPEILFLVEVNRLE